MKTGFSFADHSINKFPLQLRTNFLFEFIANMVMNIQLTVQRRDQRVFFHSLDGESGVTSITSRTEYPIAL